MEFPVINDSIFGKILPIQCNALSIKKFLHTPTKKLLILFLFFILLISNVYSFCLFGVGTTCEKTPSNGIGNFFQGIVDFGANIFNRIFKPKPAVNPDSLPNFEVIYDDDIFGDIDGEQKIITSNTGTVRGTVVKTGKTQEVTNEISMWYDLDIVSSDIDCIGCLSDEIEAGHTLNIYYSIKNYGNIYNTDKFNLKGRIITPDGDIPLNYEAIAAYIVGGSEIEFVEPIPRFGIGSNGKIKDWALGFGYTNITIELEITNDHATKYAGITERNIPQQRTYKDEKIYKKCVDEMPDCPDFTVDIDCGEWVEEYLDICEVRAKQVFTYTKTEKVYTCPDGIETEFSNGADCKIEELGQENEFANKIIASFPIKKLNAPLSGSGGFGLIG